MSLAASTVEMWEASAPESRLQPVASWCWVTRNDATSRARGRLRVRREVAVERGVAQAVDRRAVAGATRVEAHHVEVVEQRLAEGLRAQRGVRRAGLARPTGVDHERAEPRPGSAAGTFSRAIRIVRARRVGGSRAARSATRTGHRRGSRTTGGAGRRRTPAPGEGGCGRRRHRRGRHRASVRRRPRRAASASWAATRAVPATSTTARTSATATKSRLTAWVPSGPPSSTRGRAARAR